MRSLPHRNRPSIPCCPVLPLIRTLLDITLLKKGPDALPRSWIVLYLTIGLWLAALLVTAAFIERFRAGQAAVAIAVAVVGAACYLGVLVLTRRLDRGLQTLSAIVGTGALISFALVAELVLLTPLIGAVAADFGAIIIVFWSVPVKGHIIARAIDQHWFAGIAIAMAVFILQVALSEALTTEALTTET